MRLIDQVLQILFAAKARLDLKIIADVISMVRGAAKNGREPDRIETKLLDIVQLFGHAADRSAKGFAQVFGLQPLATLTGVEAVDKDLINPGSFCPFWHLVF